MAITWIFVAIAKEGFLDTSAGFFVKNVKVNQTNMKNSINLIQLLTQKKYRKMDLAELTFIVDEVLFYKCFGLIEGDEAEDKAKSLIEYFDN